MIYIYGILLIVGIVIISRNKNLHKLFWKYFLITSGVLLIFYLTLDPSQFLSNIMGILLIAFIFSVLFVFIKKWIIERKESHTLENKKEKIPKEKWWQGWSS